MAPPFSGPSGLLVGPADGGVHRHGPADVVSTIGRCQERGKDPFPGTVHGTPEQPFMSGLVSGVPRLATAGRGPEGPRARSPGAAGQAPQGAGGCRTVLEDPAPALQRQSPPAPGVVHLVQERLRLHQPRRGRHRAGRARLRRLLVAHQATFALPVWSGHGCQRPANS